MGERWSVRVLEGPRLEREGVAVRLPTTAARVLACLALRQGEVVGADELIDGVWGHAPPSTARKSLENQIVRLRTTLGADAIETSAAGYRLPADAVTSDIAEFGVLEMAATRVDAETAGRPRSCELGNRALDGRNRSRLRLAIGGSPYLRPAPRPLCGNRGTPCRSLDDRREPRERDRLRTPTRRPSAIPGAAMGIVDARSLPRRTPSRRIERLRHRATSLSRRDRHRARADAASPRGTGRRGRPAAALHLPGRSRLVVASGGRRDRDLRRAQGRASPTSPKSSSASAPGMARVSWTCAASPASGRPHF